MGLEASVEEAGNYTPVRYQIRLHAKNYNFFLNYGTNDPTTAMWALTTDFPNYNGLPTDLDPKDPFFDTRVILAISAIWDPA